MDWWNKVTPCSFKNSSAQIFSSLRLFILLGNWYTTAIFHSCIHFLQGIIMTLWLLYLVFFLSKVFKICFLVAIPPPKAFFIPKNGLHIISWFTFLHEDNFVISISMDWKLDMLNLASRHIKRLERENCWSLQEFIFSPLVASSKHSGQLVWDSTSVLLNL